MHHEIILLIGTYRVEDFLDEAMTAVVEVGRMNSVLIHMRNLLGWLETRLAQNISNYI